MPCVHVVTLGRSTLAATKHKGAVTGRRIKPTSRSSCKQNRKMGGRGRNPLGEERRRRARARHLSSSFPRSLCLSLLSRHLCLLLLFLVPSLCHCRKSGEGRKPRERGQARTFGWDHSLPLSSTFAFPLLVPASCPSVVLLIRRPFCFWPPQWRTD